MKKKILCALAVLLVMMSANVALAKNYFDKNWAVGEYPCVLTEEDETHAATLLEAALRDSEGILFRKSYDAYSCELEYENYLSVSKDGPLPERYFDDIGSYGYVIGLPDEKAIGQEQAQAIAYRVVQEQYQATDEMLTHFLPYCFYSVYDSENPIWNVALKCYDSVYDMSFGISIYAYDGSIWGIVKTEGSVG